MASAANVLTNDETAIESDTSMSVATIKAAIDTLDIESNALNSLAATISGPLRTTFLAVVDLVKDVTENKGRVIITGMGKSGHVARKIAATLASTGTPSHFVHPGEASHGDLGMIVKGDCVIAISNSGETAELSSTLTHCKRFNIPLIGITSRAASSLGQTANYLLLLPNAPEACPMGLAPTTSTTLAMALGDAIAVALLGARNFTAQNFRVLHPGGKLGSSLIMIGDLMTTGDDVPLVKVGTSFGDALDVMSAKKKGCVGVVDDNGALVGMITDGDVRRALQKNKETSPVGERVETLMTKNPRTMTADLLASEAVNFMNEKQITAIFIVDGDKPVGFLHAHDCLRAGVA